ncbi:hypothetical protein [Gottfriedia solisilvae]|uniref:hypothetical protein n=1 Tax=Gottfriedia solisilvae TaxID=1516104 RepID=UPI003D2EC253
MKKKNNKQLGFLLMTSGLLIMLISTIAYYTFSSTVSTSPYTTVQLDMSNKEITKTTDLIYVKEKEKNGSLYEIKHILKNSGNKDITRINLKGLLLQKKNQNEAQYIFIKLIKFGNQIYTPKFLIHLGFDVNMDQKVSLVEFSKGYFPLGSLVKNKEREFILHSKYEKGLPPFNSDNPEARIIFDISYQLE